MYIAFTDEIQKVLNLDDLTTIRSTPDLTIAKREMIKDRLGEITAQGWNGHGKSDQET